MKNFYLPTTKEIEEACRKIQSTWTEEEKLERQVYRQPAKLKIIKESEIVYESPIQE